MFNGVEQYDREHCKASEDIGHIDSCVSFDGFVHAVVCSYWIIFYSASVERASIGCGVAEVAVVAVGEVMTS